MAKKTAIREFLKSENLTEAQMDAFWKDLLDTNPIVAQLHRSNVDWRALNMYAIREIPTQKAKDLERLEKERKEAEETEKARIKAENDAKYYEDNFEDIMITRITDGVKLTEEELRRLVWDYEVEKLEGDSSRWTRHITSIIGLKDRFFAIHWQQGLTEAQDSMYDNQPYEVRKHTYQKTITVVEWPKI